MDTNNNEDYIDYSKIANDKFLKNIYQIQIDNQQLVIKHIGKGSHVPDIIVKEEFGSKKNLYLYNCVYANDEIDFLKENINQDKFLPIVKLIQKNDKDKNFFTISVKFNTEINYDAVLTNFDIYLTYTINNNIYHIDLEKNINSTNIIEILFGKLNELNIKL